MNSIDLDEKWTFRRGESGFCGNVVGGPGDGGESSP